MSRPFYRMTFRRFIINTSANERRKKDKYDKEKIIL